MKDIEIVYVNRDDTEQKGTSLAIFVSVTLSKLTGNNVVISKCTIEYIPVTVGEIYACWYRHHILGYLPNNR